MTPIIKQFGLLGRNIDYSFSQGYFTKKFDSENLEGYNYKNFDIQTIDSFLKIITDTPNLAGMNVTIPYKEQVIPFLDKLSKKATKIGAVNTIKFTKKGKLKGYNTDFYGFKKSLKPLLENHHTKALIIGTGGASKGVAFALEELGIEYLFVSRQEKENCIQYHHITDAIFTEYTIIINCTPVGSLSSIDMCPEIPYAYFSEKHIAYDLIYNPDETLFLKKAKEQGAKTKNGLDMLIFQAEKAWKIWNKS